MSGLTFKLRLADATSTVTDMRKIVCAAVLLSCALVPAALLSQEDESTVVAVVLDEEIHRSPEMDGRRLMGLVLQTLLERWAKAQDLEPTEAEIQSFLEGSKAAAEALPDVGQPARVDLPDSTERKIAHRFVRSFKINRALYEAYAGRVIFQQFGPEPIDAYRRFLEERQKAGAFRIVDESLVDEFWRYLVDDDMHAFYPPEEQEYFITTPWWEMEADEN